MAAVLTAACASAPAPRMPDSRPDRPAHVLVIEPANIRRVAAELPPGYEVASVASVFSPAGSWGLGSDWTADPARCAALADPGRGRGGVSDSAQGVSGSGAGGIVYAVVVALPADPVTANPADIADCGRWVMTNRHATAGIRLIDAPGIDGVETLGIASNTTTSVEGGTQIASRAHTFTAYLGDYYAFTTLITDPGSTHPQLPARFAADLLVKTVSVLHGRPGRGG